MNAVATMDKLNKMNYTMRLDGSVLYRVNNAQRFHFRDSSTLTDEERIVLQKKKRKERAYKTALCPLFMAGKCLRGARCLFAHGEGELRPLSQVHQNFRTRLCVNFETVGYCRYGERCYFIHRAPAAMAPNDVGFVEVLLLSVLYVHGRGHM
uniref:C3H1-type domain-containing protein n=1 Tax=Ascaris lumbricoides TaxID=6252 RepID=A0A0M3IR89_ASCLU